MSERITAAEFVASQKTGKKHKYAAERTEAFGLTFPSKKEARRYGTLRQLQLAGEVKNLKCQVRIPLIGRDGPLKTERGRQICYVADFTYSERGSEIVEDAKGFKTPEYILKKAILKSMGIEIRET